MSKAKVMAGQNLLDVVVQETGSMEKAMDVALDNGLNITDDLTPGQEINIDEELQKDNYVVSDLQLKGAKPATGTTAIEVPGGINYMGIEIDFIVS